MCVPKQEFSQDDARAEPEPETGTVGTISAGAEIGTENPPNRFQESKKGNCVSLTSTVQKHGVRTEKRTDRTDPCANSNQAKQRPSKVFAVSHLFHTSQLILNPNFGFSNIYCLNTGLEHGHTS